MSAVHVSRAYGLDEAGSDTDRRGIYLPPAELPWSLYGVPEQLEGEGTEEVYWELQKFLALALKANPNILECLYSPLVEHATPLVGELLAMRSSFLSRLVYQTYNGYVLSQFRRIEQHRRNHEGRIKPKHPMHLIRLLLAGIRTLREGAVPVHVGEHRARLLAIRRWEDHTERGGEGMVVKPLPFIAKGRRGIVQPVPWKGSSASLAGSRCGACTNASSACWRSKANPSIRGCSITIDLGQSL